MITEPTMRQKAQFVAWAMQSGCFDEYSIMDWDESKNAYRYKGGLGEKYVSEETLANGFENEFIAYFAKHHSQDYVDYIRKHGSDRQKEILQESSL